MIGNIKKSDVVSIFAETKVGKTWMLVNMFKHCVQSRLKTIYFSIEMTQEEINQRIEQAFFPMTTRKGEQRFPEFDCIHNQTGECADRTSTVVVREDDEFLDDPAHVVCQKCMRSDPERYEQAIYHSLIDREEMDEFGLKRAFIKNNNEKTKLAEMMSKYGRVISKEKYDLSYTDIVKIVKVLANQGFIPDVVILDYADILELGHLSTNSEWRKEDDRWKLLPKLYKYTKSLLITATQAKSSEGDYMSSDNQRGYKGKSMHVNKMIGVSQTPDQKRDGIIQVNITESRQDEFFIDRNCYILQDLNSGQAYLDSYCKDLHLFRRN
jgi:hypothetical protein